MTVFGLRDSTAALTMKKKRKMVPLVPRQVKRPLGGTTPLLSSSRPLGSPPLVSSRPLGGGNTPLSVSSRPSPVNQAGMGPYFSKPVKSPYFSKPVKTPATLRSSPTKSLVSPDYDDDEESVSKKPRLAWFQSLLSESPQKELSEKLSEKKLVCDRCDGAHETLKCPHFKKEREDAAGHAAMGTDCGRGFLRSAEILRQPGDGSCLFHALYEGKKRLRNTDVKSASGLRQDLVDWLLSHEDANIADAPVKNWVLWDAGTSLLSYAQKMRNGAWGGGIEMAAFAHLYDIEVHVYEQQADPQFPFRRISRFCCQQKGKAPKDSENSNKAVVSVLYCGGVHYDALVPTSPLVFLDKNDGDDDNKTTATTFSPIITTKPRSPQQTKYPPTSPLLKNKHFYRTSPWSKGRTLGGGGERRQQHTTTTTTGGHNHHNNHHRRW